jgi:hypothetical protein
VAPIIGVQSPHLPMGHCWQPLWNLAMCRPAVTAEQHGPSIAVLES